MSAEISPEMRAMIDAAIAAGKVTVVPMGANTAPVYQWRDAKGNSGAGLYQVGGADVSYRQQGKNFLAQARKAAAARRHLRPDVVAAAARLPRVRELAAQGMTRTEIAEALGVPRTTIAKDCKQYGIETVNPQLVARERAIARVRELAAQGKTIKQIASEMGRFYDDIKKYCKTEGIEVVNGHDAARSRRVEMVRKAIEGKSDICLTRLAAELGLARTTVRKYVAEVGA